MIGIPLGLAFANAMEWVIHKHVLHGLGKKRDSFFAFHWHDHHRSSRANAMGDPRYEEAARFQWDARTKELVGMGVTLLPFLPLAPVAPFFVGALVYSSVDYYRKHSHSHRDPAWAREHLPWHYDHHMGPDQDANWCVTRPWMDELMGTRKRYAFTEREARDLERRAAREKARPTPAASPAPAMPVTAPPLALPATA
jgi:sterol desaturase/sphingolipid hydroxylase (fatty acid hydroxylase superfamily)